MANIGQSTITNNTGIPQNGDACIVMIKTEWNAALVDELENGCRKVLKENGYENLKTVTVPGAFEIPFGIKNYYQQHSETAVFIAFAVVVRGGTPHFEYVCQAVTQGVLQLNLSLPVPTVFGVLTVDDEIQAKERLGGVHGHKGEEAAFTALKLLRVIEENS